MPFYDIMDKEHGAVYTYSVGPMIRLAIVDPSLIRQVLIVNNDCYVKNAIMRSFKLFGHGLLTAQGELWAHQRRLIKPAFSQSAIKVGFCSCVP